MNASSHAYEQVPLFNQCKESGSTGVIGQPETRKGGGDLEGHLQIPAGMVMRGGRRQSIAALHMSRRTIFCSSKGLWKGWLPFRLEVEAGSSLFNC